MLLVAVCCAARVCGERKINWLIPEEELSKIHPSAEPTPGGEQEREGGGGRVEWVLVGGRLRVVCVCDCSLVKYNYWKPQRFFLLTLR